MVNIGKYDESYLLQRAEEIVISKTTGSNILDPDAEAAIPRFQPNGKTRQFIRLFIHPLVAPFIIQVYHLIAAKHLN
jgi:hypothetical protein